MKRWLEKIGGVAIAPTTRRRLIYGICLFFVFKLLFVSFGLLSMQGPRLGDDSYVYLWFAKANSQPELYDTPGVKSLETFASQIDPGGLDAETRFRFFRVIMRIVGHPRSNYLHAVFGPLHDTGLSFQTLFWVEEVFVLAIMSAGLWLLFRAKPSPPGLILLLPLLALALLPGQGLHFLIPSTLALSFGFLIWGAVLSSKQRPILLLLCGAGAMLSHKIGVAHAGIGGIVVVLRLFLGRITFKRAAIEAAILLALLAIYLGLLAAGALNPGLSGGYTGLGLEYVYENLKGALVLAARFAGQDPMTAIIAAVGLGAVVRRRADYPGHALLLTVILTVLLVSSVYHVEEYDGDVLARFMVPAFVICFGFAYAAQPGAATPVNHKRRIGLFYLVFALAIAGNSFAYALANWEKRWPQLDSNAISAEVSKLPARSHILYFDEEFALLSSFVSGGFRYFSSSGRMLLANPSKGEQWLADHPPSHVAMLVPRTLLPRARYDHGLFTKRRYGFKLNHKNKLELTVPAKETRLLLKTGAVNQGISVRSGGSDCKHEAAGEWLAVDLSSCGDDVVTERSVVIDGTGFVSGISLDQAEPRMNWPWGSDIAYSYKPVSWTGIRYKEIRSAFSWSKINPYLSDAMFAEIRDRLVAVSDESGLLIGQID